VVITGPNPIDFSNLQMGNVTTESFAFPFDGRLDHVKLFEQELSPTDVNTLHTKPYCGD
jgi:hypothetical protein